MQYFSHSFFPLLSVLQHNVSTRILLCRDSVFWGMSTELLTKTDVYYLNKFWVAYNLACQLFWHLCIIVCLTTSNLTGMVTVMPSAFIWLFLSNGIFYAELYWPPSLAAAKLWIYSIVIVGFSLKSYCREFWVNMIYKQCRWFDFHFLVIEPNETSKHLDIVLYSFSISAFV